MNLRQFNLIILMFGMICSTTGIIHRNAEFLALGLGIFVMWILIALENERRE